LSIAGLHQVNLLGEEVLAPLFFVIFYFAVASNLRRMAQRILIPPLSSFSSYSHFTLLPFLLLYLFLSFSLETLGILPANTFPFTS
jgi:hypothetical protein